MKRFFWHLYLGAIILYFCLHISISSIFPLVGTLDWLRINFTVIFVIYFGSNTAGIGLPWFILALNLIHSLFSLESFAMNTLISLALVGIIRSSMGLLDFSSAVSIILINFVGSVLWLLLAISIYYLKTRSGEFCWQYFIHFLPGIFIIAFFSPVFFKIFKFLSSKASYESQAL